MSSTDVRAGSTADSTILLSPAQQLQALSVPNERTLKLVDGRTLAYSCGGDESSKKVCIFLHGVFGVGATEEYASNYYARLGWRCLAPTLPGWGTSSPFPAGRPVSAYTGDIQELIEHTVGTPTHIFFFGGSYGSIWAYALAANQPPAGIRRIEPASAIRGLLILGGFSPYSDDDGYAAACQGMSFMNWITVGRPGKSIFLRWIHPMVGKAIQGKILAGGQGAALDILRMILTGPKAMKPEERTAINAWTESLGTDFATWESGMARNVALSVRDCLDGYVASAPVINSEWGFKLSSIRIPGSLNSNMGALVLGGPADVPASLPPVVIGGCIRDHLAPIAMQRFVAGKIPGAQLIELEGNHISAITSLYPIVTAMIKGIEAADAKH